MSHNIYSGKVNPKQVFDAWRLDPDGTANIFETDQAVTDTFTLNLLVVPRDLKSGRINNLYYMMNPDNAVTYTLYIGAVAIADDMSQAFYLLYESAAARAKGTFYRIDPVDRCFWLLAPGQIYYAVDWSAAPGNCPGFIRMLGELYQ